MVRIRQFCARMVVGAATIFAVVGASQAATSTWDGGGGDGNWMTAANWVDDIAPVPGADDLIFTGTTNLSTNNDFSVGSVFYGVSFSSGADPFTLAGNGLVLGTFRPIALSGNVNLGAISNADDSLQTISLPVTISKGNHVIGTTAGSGALNLTNTLTLDTGGTVIFARNGASPGNIDVTGTGLSLTNGILGGWAPYNDHATVAHTATGWATLDGSDNVVLYSHAVAEDYAAGAAIASAATANVRINSTGAANSLTEAAVTDINSLVLTGTAANHTLNIATGQTLRLGANGGILNASAGLGTARVFNVGQTAGQGTLTAGGADGMPGVITFIDTPTNAGGGNNLAIRPNVTDNIGGGAVRVNILGYVQMDGASTNTFSGGLYINQGRVQSDANGLGTGDIHVSPGGQLFVNANGSITNPNIFISGFGTPESGGNGAIRMGGTGRIFTGTLWLEGDAATANGTVSGRIRGTGRLIVGAGSGNGVGTLIVGSASGANDYSGDTVINNPGTWGGVAATGASTLQIATGRNDIMPHGTGFGNLILNGTTVVATMNLNGTNQIINGLSNLGATSANSIVTSGVAGAATLTVGDGDATGNTFAGIIQNGSGTVGVTKIGSGTQTLSGVNTYTGPTSVNNGTLALSNAGTNNIASPAINVNSGGTLSTGGLSGGGITVAAGQSLTNNGSVTGNVTADNATATVKGTGNYAGTVNITGGILAPGGSIGEVSINDLSMSAGTWQVELGGTSADNIAANTATFTGGNITLVPTSLPTGTSYSILTAATSLTGTPAITNPTLGRMNFSLDTSEANKLKLTQTGNALVLRWDNTAPATGDGATWDINTNQNWVSAGTPETYFDFDSVTFNDQNNGKYSVTVVGTVSPLSVTVDNSANDYSIGGAGSIAGSTGITKTGSRKLTLSSANAFSGPVAINGGTVSISASNNLGNAAASNTISMAGGTLESTGATVDLGATRSVALGAGGGTIDVTGANSLTVPGVVSGAAADTLTKSGTGTLVLSGSNTYSGVTNVNAGTVAVTNSAALGAVASAADVNVAAGAAVDLGPAAQGSINFGGKVMKIAGSGVGGTGALTNSSGNTQLNAFNFITLAADATIGGHRMDIGRVPTPAAGGVLDLNGKTLTIAMTSIGAGTQPFFGVLDEADVIGNGSIEVSSGALGFEVDAQALAANVTGITFLNTVAGAHLQLFRQTAGGVTAPMTFKGNNIIGGGTNSGIIGQVDSPMTLEADITVQGLASGIPSTTANNPIIIAGPIGESGGARGITITGGSDAGTIQRAVTTLAGTNTYSGTTTIASGILQIGGLQADTVASYNAAQTTTNPAGPSGTLGTGPVVNNSTLRFNRSNVNAAANAISGTGAVQKFGGDVLTLSGTNSYSGTTAVSAGTLLVTGTHTGAGKYGASTGATLGGSGTITFSATGSMDIDSGATLAPGASIGTLQLDGVNATDPVLNLDSGALLSFELGSGNTADKLEVVGGQAGDVVFNGNTINFTDTTAGALAPGSYTLFSSNVSGAYANLALTGSQITGGLTIGTGLAAYNAATSLRQTGNDILLNLVVLPGDYNANGSVDSADYVVWRDNDGTSNSMLNDATPGTVDSTDYDLWRANFGNSFPGSGGSATVPSVPEPTSVMLALMVAGALALAGRRRPLSK